MRLVFFWDAIEHVSRLARVLRQPRGNAMLVGVGGSGKQSLTRFAAYLAEMKCFQIELTKGYGYMEFREDLKKLYFVAGCDGVPVVFLFADTQIVVEAFIEDMNNILNSGEVPNLFASDEWEKIISQCAVSPPCIQISPHPTTHFVALPSYRRTFSLSPQSAPVLPRRRAAGNQGQYQVPLYLTCPREPAHRLVHVPCGLGLPRALSHVSFFD